MTKVRSQDIKKRAWNKRKKKSRNLSQGMLQEQSTKFLVPTLLTEKAMAPHSSTLAWKIPRTEEPGRLQSMGSLRVGHDWATSLSLFTSCIGEGNGNPLQCSCLENPGTAEPGGLPSMGPHRVGQDWSDLAAAAAESSQIADSSA